MSLTSNAAAPLMAKIYGTADDDVIDESGATGEFYVNAGAGDDRVVGSIGNDHIVDYRGDDSLSGGDGDDRIEGGQGSDVLEGGAGRDTFIFGGKGLGDGDIDHIVDFNFGEDTLVFRDLNGSTALVKSLDDLRNLSSDKLQVTEADGEVRVSLSNDAGSQSIILRREKEPTDETAPPSETTDAGSAPSEFLLVLSTGQSLSVGATAKETQRTYWSEPVDDQRAFSLNFGNEKLSSHGWQGAAIEPGTFRGFAPLREFGSETHASAMVGQLLSVLDDTHANASVVHFHNGVGGRSILELMTRPEDVYSSIETAIAATSRGDVFAVSSDDRSWAYYVAEGGGRAYRYREDADPPVSFENLTTQLELAVDHARALGIPVSKTVALSFIQGQSDTNTTHAEFDYGYLMDLYFDRIRDAASKVVGDEIELVVSVSQTRGFGGKNISIEQIGYIEDAENVHLGALEAQFQAYAPAEVGGSSTHLSPEGYAMLGSHIGQRLGDALNGAPDDAIVITDVRRVAPDTLRVSFDGVEGELVYDPSRYAPENGFVPPSDFGFRLYDTRGYRGSETPLIETAEIVSANEVELNFNKDVQGAWRLYLGRTEENLINTDFHPTAGRNFGGTTLRDSIVDIGLSPSGGTDLRDINIYEFAPIQYTSFDTADLGLF